MDDTILRFIGKAALCLGGFAAIAAFAWGIFRFFGEKWIENKFHKSLEDHRHKHDEEIARLKCEIDSQLSRVTKMHEKELEVLPEAWKRLVDLLDSVIEFLRETHSTSQDGKYEVLSKRVGDVCWDFQGYIETNAIFLLSTIKTEFKKAEEIIRTAWVKRDEAESSEERSKGIREACKIIQKELPPIRKRIEELVQERLGLDKA